MHQRKYCTQSRNAIKQAIARLEEEFCLQQLRYWLVTTGPKDQNFDRGFSVLGRTHVLDLAPLGNGELRPQRIVKLSNRNFDDRPIYLMRETLEFCDKTVANIMQAAAISALKAVVAETDSWIAGWKGYNEEEERILEERFGRLPDLHYKGQPLSSLDELLISNSLLRRDSRYGESRRLYQNHANT